MGHALDIDEWRSHFASYATSLRKPATDRTPPTKPLSRVERIGSLVEVSAGRRRGFPGNLTRRLILTSLRHRSKISEYGLNLPIDTF
jgi:hypothetical protein